MAKKAEKSKKDRKPDKAPSDSTDARSGDEIDTRADFPVVGIGASAGGLDAFRQFLNGVSPDSGVAYVLVQHLDPNHESLMAELLSRRSPIPVVEAQDGMAIEPDHVYMIPPNKFIRIADHGLFLDQPIHRRGMRMPIDYFFRSLAEAHGESSICIILSGTGSDGTLGLRDIKAAGGISMVQKPETADYDGMPRSAINTGLVDFVLPIEEMPAKLIDFLKHPYLRPERSRQNIAASNPEAFNSIVSLLRAHTDYDFRCYKPGTLDRRIQRRMSLKHISQASDYLKLLREDTDELQLLFKDLLIGVTRFFRDPEVWEALRNDVITPMVEAKSYDQAIRVWVVGCATGEEAYTLAMLIYEELEAQKKNLAVQIYATDLDADAIEVARAGWYPGSISPDISPQRLSRFFQEEGDGYRVAKRLRESVVFASQNVISDPPFSRLDLVSCRNLMIYLEASVQQKLLELFHFALAEDGHLLLGSSESTTQSGKLFESLSGSNRIYRRGTSGKPARAQFPITGTPPDERRAFRVAGRALADTGDATRVEAARRILLEQFVPASVLVNRKFEVQYYHGRVRDYLDYPSGEPEMELPKLALEGLKAKLRGTLTRALHDNEYAEDVARSVRRDGGRVAVRIQVRPIAHSGEEGPFLLVSFQDAATPETDPERPAESPQTEEERTLVQQLEYELQATREDLQSTIEEVETSNEELKASNEEVMSMNEELQSSNEELETSREELQSLNEELTTVNNQLQEKVQELESINNDLDNLLVSTELATVFLDTDLRIRRFTPAASDLLHLIDGDVGRPIEDLAPRLKDENLLSDAKDVLRRLQPVESEAKHDSGRTFVRRILPYRTSDNRIDGVVITLSDVTRLRDYADRLRSREAQQRAIAELGRAALGTSGEIQPLLDRATGTIKEFLGCPMVKILEYQNGQNAFLLRAGTGWHEGLVGSAVVPGGGDSQAGFTLTRREPVVVEDLRKETRFNGPQLLADHDVVSGVSVIIGPVENPWGVVGAHSSERRSFDKQDTDFLVAASNILHEAIERNRIATRLSLALDASDLGIWEWNLATDESVWDPRLYALIDVDPDIPAKGEVFFERVHPDDVADFHANIQSAKDNGTGFQHEFRVVHRDGTIHWLSGMGVPVFGPDGKVAHFVGVNGDITDKKLADEQIAESEERYRLAMQATADLVYDVDLKSDIATRSEGMYGLIGIMPDNAPAERGWWSERIHPEDRDAYTAELEAAFSGGEEYFELTYRVRHEEDGSWVHIHDQGIVLRDDSGTPVRMVGSRRDITERVELDRKLGEEQERRRLALEATEIGTWEWPIETDEMIWDERQCEIFGIPSRDHVPLADIESRIHSGDIEKREEALRQAVESDQPYKCEFRLVANGTATRWISEEGNLVGRGANKRMFGVSFDVTAEKEKQARDAMLLAELDHRVKNILANILAVVRQSRQGKPTIADFVTTLEGRLFALSNTHTLLSSRKWNGVELNELLETILAPYSSPGSGRISLAGPNVILRPSAAQSLGLTIHELVTNAAKHGALSNSEGRVNVDWAFASDGEVPSVDLTWTESGGPEVSAPAEKNFGLMVVERLCASEIGAKAVAEFPPEGFRLRLEMPRDKVLAQGEQFDRQSPTEDDATQVQGVLSHDGGLPELNILLVEDSWTVATQFKGQLEALGHAVIGPASNLTEAEALAELDEVDVALLDIQIGEERVFPVADILRKRGVPIAFVTGYTDEEIIPETYREVPNLSKPCTDVDLMRTLRLIYGSTVTGG